MKLKKFFSVVFWELQNFFQVDLNYLLKGGAWWALGRAISFLGSFLILFFFARFATKEVYGTYQYVLSTAAILSLLLLPGLDSALVRSVAQGKERTFFLIEKAKIRWGIVTFFVFFAVSLWYFFHQNFQLGASFFFAGLLFPFLSIFSLYFSFWYGKKRFDIQNIYFVLHNLLGASIFCLFIYLKPQIPFVVFAFYFSFTLSSFVFWFKTRKKIQKQSFEDKEAISFGKHLTLMSLPGTISQQIDNILLWQFWGPEVLAIYTFALRLVQRIQEVIPFAQLALPKMAEKDFSHPHAKSSIFNKFLKLFLFSIPFTLGLILILPVVFKIFFPRYLQSVFWAQLISTILFFIPVSFLQVAFLAAKKTKELYFISTLPELTKIVCFFVFIPFWGIKGAVASILISCLVATTVTLIFWRNL